MSATAMTCDRLGRLLKNLQNPQLFDHPIGGFELVETVAAGIYDSAMTDRTYKRLLDLARIVSGCGIPVIVDATFLARKRREAFAALARSLGTPFRILDFRAGEAALRARIAHRAAEGHNASEADLAVLEHQRRSQESLTPHEQSLTLIWDTECPGEATPIAADLERLTQCRPTR